MGGYFSKEWTEVNTMGSPDAETKEEVSNVAKRRILKVDPRSISDDVTRTPIQVEKTPLEGESTPKNFKGPAFMDPRSPSQELPRTPIAPTMGKHPLYFDDETLEEGKDVAKAIAAVPKRGAVSNEIKDVETKLELLNVNKDDSYEKEEGEITHDSDDEDVETPKGAISELSLEKTPLKFQFHQHDKVEDEVVEERDDGKEEGEITHDSDDENRENFEPVKDKTPVKQFRIKTSLENDCRSPLLIENDEPAVFEKALTNELAVMAQRSAKKKEAAKSNPLSERNVGNNDDSLII